MNAPTAPTAPTALTALTALRGTLSIKEGITSPPTHLTESALISLMESNGIGTDASIPTHIENIQKRGYAELGNGRRLRPSKLGLVLAQGFLAIDQNLILPAVRAEIEGECDDIAKGNKDKNYVVAKALRFFEDKFCNFVKNVGKMDLLFGSSFSQLVEEGSRFTRCGLTRRYLQYIEGPPRRLYNPVTEIVYPLPRGGVIRQWSGGGGAPCANSRSAFTGWDIP